MFQKGETVLLVGSKNFLITLDGEMKRVKGLGIVDSAKILEIGDGDTITMGSEKFRVYTPSLEDLLENMKRGPQIIGLKDASVIISLCSLRAGNTVIEGGSGSGFLTTMLANAVFPGGKVISYDRNETHQRIAEGNVGSAGLSDVVKFRIGNLGEDYEGEADAFVMDIPEPWTALPHAKRVLKSGGHLCVYVPTVNQLEKIVREMREANFWRVKALELLSREMVVHSGGVRPDFQMLGHTGYIIHGRAP